MKNYRTTFNVLQNDKDSNFEHGESYNLEVQPSLTDPSQAMEIKDIYNAFSRGGAVRILRSQNFGEEIPQEFEAISQRIHTMDKTERAEASLQLKQIINEKTTNIDKNKKQAEKLKTIAKAKAEAKAEAKQNPLGAD